MIRVVALGVEGIFRVSPKSFELERMKEHFDNSEADVDPSKFTSAHVVCGLLKLYLREVCSLRHTHTHTLCNSCYLLLLTLMAQCTQPNGG
jgi:hypothetical protein